MPHLTYCISAWGGVSKYKLQTIFSIQKRCIRLLFGKVCNYDHFEFYETCARIRSIDEHRATKDYCLEHTKNNFVFKASNIWNKLQQYVFSRSKSDSNGVIVPGFSTHSDLSISICIAKVRLKSYLFTYQMSGDPITWS